MFRAAGPNLLTIDDVMTPLSPRKGAQGQRIGATGRLCHAKGLQSQFTRGYLRQIALFLFRISMPQDCPHHVNLGVTGGPIATLSLNFLKDRNGPGQRHAGTTIFFRNQNG